MEKRDVPLFIDAAGYLLSFNNNLFAALRRSGVSDKRLYELLKAEDPKLIERLVRVFARTGAVATLADMLKAGRYDWVNPVVTAKNFPVKPELYTAEGSEVFSFNRIITTAQVEAAIKNEGYESDPIEKLLAYGKKNPDEQRKCSIISLGSSCVTDGRGVPYLGRDGRGRYVSLYWVSPGYQWYPRSRRFLASPQVKR